MSRGLSGRFSTGRSLGASADLTSGEHRLRGGKSFVASAPQAFADPSASTPDVPSIAGCYAVGAGNPWRFPPPTEADKGQGWLCRRKACTAKVSSHALLERSPTPPPRPPMCPWMAFSRSSKHRWRRCRRPWQPLALPPADSREKGHGWLFRLIFRKRRD